MSNDASGRSPGDAGATPSDERPGGTRNAGGDGWFSALLALLTTAAIVVVAMTAPLLVELGSGLSPGDLTDLPVPGGVAPEARAGWWHLIAFQATCVILAVVMADHLRRDTALNLAWQPPIGRLSWLGPFVVTALVSVVLAILALTFFPEVVARDLKPIREMVRAGPLWLAFVALAIGAPLSEELLFRGYLLQRLKRTPVGFWGGALIANAGWTALHVGYSPLSLADVFIAGLLFSWALWRTGSIWVPIAFHAIYNAVVLFIIVIPEPGEAAVAALAGGLAP